MSMSEDQAQWVECDGMNNLPPAHAVGVYELRRVEPSPHMPVWWSYFDGNKFYASSSQGHDGAECYYELRIEKHRGDWGEIGNCVDAWRDYQGLCKAGPAFSASITETPITITAKPDEGVLSPILPSDAPGIESISVPAKQQDAPTIINGVTVDPAALAAFLESQKPKPAPNNTPRGILTLAPINHRLGLWDNPLYD